MSLAAPVRRPVLADLIARPTGRARAFALDAALVVTGAVFVAALAQLEVPLWPVPVTGQTRNYVWERTVFDGLLRPRRVSTQSPAQAGGYIVSRTVYDKGNKVGKTQWLR